MQICVVVLAHNEERRIVDCLASLPCDLDHVAVHLVVNGSTDRTAEIGRSFDGVTVHEYQAGGKARSWNRIMFDTPGIEADAYVYVDGDAVILPGSVQALAQATQGLGVNAAAGLPANGRRVAYYRQSILEDHGLFGDLYALSGDFVARLRDSGLRLPQDLIGDDSLIGALAKTDLQSEIDWRDERVVPVRKAQFLCEPVAPTMQGAKLQMRRMVNYSLRHFQNRIITTIMRSTGPSGLPDQMVELYGAHLPRFKPRRDPANWWFDRKALARMRCSAAAWQGSHGSHRARTAV